jgi:DNA mismatch endonuclease (patch repair protein)
MSDVFTKEIRSEIMSRIKSANTRPEFLVRKFIFSHGYRYRLHQKSLIGKPDIVLKKLKTVINVHGCFWHGHKGCKLFKMPKTNNDFWKHKISNTIQRDKIAEETLKNDGWTVITIWECSLRPNKREKTLSDLLIQLNSFSS